MNWTGETIRAIRISKGYTQEQFSRKLAIGRKHLSKIECGERGVSANVSTKMDLLYGEVSLYRKVQTSRAKKIMPALLYAVAYAKNNSRQLGIVNEALETVKAMEVV